MDADGLSIQMRHSPHLLINGVCREIDACILHQKHQYVEFARSKLQLAALIGGGAGAHVEQHAVPAQARFFRRQKAQRHARFDDSRRRRFYDVIRRAAVNSL